MRWYIKVRRNKINFDSARVFTIFIRPINVSFLHFQTFSTLSMLRNLSSKFNLSALALSYEKKTPNAQIGSSGHLKLKGVSCLSFQQPSHIASVFDVLTCRPDMDLNYSSMFSSCKIESVSCTKTVVLSAYMEVFISSSPITIPFMRASRLIALARSSRPMSNNKPDNGQPCLTPHFVEKNLKRGCCLTRSWKYWNAKFETIVKNFGRNGTTLGPSLGNAIRLYRRLCGSQGRQQFQADFVSQCKTLNLLWKVWTQESFQK